MWRTRVGSGARLTPAISIAVRRVSETSFSAAVSLTLAQSIPAISGGLLKASAMNDATGKRTVGRRSWVWLSSISREARSGAACVPAGPAVKL